MEDYFEHIRNNMYKALNIPKSYFEQFPNYKNSIIEKIVLKYEELKNKNKRINYDLEL